MIQIPVEVEEAAIIDGASNWQILGKIIFPLCMPVVAAMGIFSFTWIFNEFFYAIVLSSIKVRTATVAISIMGSHGNQDLDWPGQMTASLVMTLPTLIVFLALQRYFIKGIMLGSIKG